MTYNDINNERALKIMAKIRSRYTFEHNKLRKRCGFTDNDRWRYRVAHRYTIEWKKRIIIDNYHLKVYKDKKRVVNENYKGKR